jgi:predicted DCC family thiol-disulfide oxidoreductase YuxK
VDDRVLVFDGNCGFCTRSVGWVRAMDRRGRIEVRPYQEPGVPESIGTDASTCADAVQWRGPDGHRLAGAAAVNAVLDTVTGTSLPSTLYRATSGLQERVYRWVADHRAQFPGMTPWCRSHPEECRRT